MTPPFELFSYSPQNFTNPPFLREYIFGARSILCAIINVLPDDCLIINLDDDYLDYHHLAI